MWLKDSLHSFCKLKCVLKKMYFPMIKYFETKKSKPRITCNFPSPKVPLSHLITKVIYWDIILSFVFFLIIYFNWKLITLQYCNGFCHTLTWLRWVYMCPPSWTPLPPPSLPFPSLRVVPGHWFWVLCLIHRTWTGDLFYIRW